MRYTVSSDQLKFFYQNLYLELENVISDQEADSLKKAIEAVLKKSPGYPPKNLYRSLARIHKLALKNGWGEIASALLKKKQLRIESDRYFTTPPSLEEPLDEERIALLINLETKTGIFCLNDLPKSNLYNSSGNCYFLLIMTTKRLHDQLNPLLVR